jgi:hypothetical protein
VPRIKQCPERKHGNLPLQQRFSEHDLIMKWKLHLEDICDEREAASATCSSLGASLDRVEGRSSVLNAVRDVALQDILI